MMRLHQTKQKIGSIAECLFLGYALFGFLAQGVKCLLKIFQSITIGLYGAYLELFTIFEDFSIYQVFREVLKILFVHIISVVRSTLVEHCGSGE